MATIPRTEKLWSASDLKKIKPLIDTKLIEILQHGYDHKDLGPNRFECQEPSIVPKLREGKKILEDFFGEKILGFVPPHNRMCRQVVDWLMLEKMFALNLVSVKRWDRPFHPTFLKALLGRIYYWKLHEMEYPEIVNHPSGYWEIGAHSLIPSTTRSELSRKLNFVHKKKIPFVLNTHYWELLLKNSQGERLIDVLKGIVEEARFLGFQFVRARDLCQPS